MAVNFPTKHQTINFFSQIDSSLLSVLEHFRSESLSTVAEWATVEELLVKQGMASGKTGTVFRDTVDKGSLSMTNNPENPAETLPTDERELDDIPIIEGPALCVHDSTQEGEDSLPSLMYVDRRSDSSMSDTGTSLQKRGRDRFLWESGNTDVSPEEGGPTCFPCFSSRWDCGEYNGKKAFVEIDNTVLGRGAIAAVYGGSFVIAEDVNGVEKHLLNIPVAIKGITFDIRIRRYSEMLMRAIQLRIEITHPGVVHTYYIHIVYPKVTEMPDSGKLMLRGFAVLARSVLGSLADELKRNGAVPLSEIKVFLREVLETLQVIHEVHQRVHNDIKPHNILLFDVSNEYGSQFKYQITDFTGVEDAKPWEEVLSDLRKSGEERLEAASVGGTALFMSPESCLGLGMLCSNDVWSLGICVFYIATGTLPWRGLETKYPSMILHGYRTKYTCKSLFGKYYSQGSADSVPHENIPTASSYFPNVSEDAENEGSNSVSTSLRGEGDEPPQYSLVESAVGANRVGQAFSEQYNDFAPILDELMSSCFPHEFQDFVLQCLTENPVDRPTCKQLRTHPFLQE